MSQAVYDYEPELTLKDYLAILKRRRYQLVVPAAIVAALALLVTLALPAKYESQATILIEEQEVPREFVVSTISSYAAQQVQVISQRVLTAESIARIADKYGLYVDPDTGSRPPSTQIADEFREAMKLDLVSADVIDPRSGRPAEATIAFTLSFEHGNPSTAQRVTNELVTLFLNENLRTRTERAANTEAFLSAEAEALSRELSDIEARVAEFKKDHVGALPELREFNLNTLERTSREVTEIDMRLKELAKRKLELSAELAQLNPWGPMITSQGQSIPSEQDRLIALRSEYRQKLAVYKPNHPDIRRLEREISELEAKYGASETYQDLAEALEMRSRELGQLSQQYQDDNPQVQAAQRLVDDLEERLEALEGSADANVRAPNNPAYVLIDTQRKSAIAEEAALLEKREELAQKVNRLEGQLARAPDVEQLYAALMRDYQNAQAKYQEVRAEQREAKLAENLEQDRKGERFVLVEPPTLPIEPASPNRPALALVGLILALGAGAAVVLVMESLDGAIHGDKKLTAIAGAPPFAVVGYIENAQDLERRKALRQRLLIGAVAGGLAFLLFVHLFIKPLDVVWFMLLNRVGG